MLCIDLKTFHSSSFLNPYPVSRYSVMIKNLWQSDDWKKKIYFVKLLNSIGRKIDFAWPACFLSN